MKLIIDWHQLIVTYDTFALGAFARTVLSYTYSNKFIGILTASYVQIYSGFTSSGVLRCKKTFLGFCSNID